MYNYPDYPYTTPQTYAPHPYTPQPSAYLYTTTRSPTPHLPTPRSPTPHRPTPRHPMNPPTTHPNMLMNSSMSMVLTMLSGHKSTSNITKMLGTTERP